MLARKEYNLLKAKILQAEIYWLVLCTMLNWNHYPSCSFDSFEKFQEKACFLRWRSKCPWTHTACENMEKRLRNLRSCWKTQNTLFWWVIRKQILPPCQRLWSEHCSDRRFVVLRLCSGGRRRLLRPSVRRCAELEEFFSGRERHWYTFAEEGPERDHSWRV